MEIILLIIALLAVYGIKAFAIMRGQADEIANATAFSWTKPDVESVAAIKAEATQASSAEWQPVMASSRLAMIH